MDVVVDASVIIYVNGDDEEDFA